jgi:hypothetical protein
MLITIGRFREKHDICTGELLKKHGGLRNTCLAIAWQRSITYRSRRTDVVKFCP